MSDKQLKEWEALTEGATPGPWGTCKPCSTGGTSTPCGLVWARDADVTVAIVHRRSQEEGVDFGEEQHLANWRLMAESRTAVPALIAEVRLSKAEEAEAVVTYLLDRARWLLAEVHAGGDVSLRERATECAALAVMVGTGRHHQGGHIL